MVNHKPQPLQIVLNRVPRSMEKLHLVREHQDIVHVPDHCPDSQPVMDEVIQRVKVEIGEVLTGKIPDWKPPPSGMRCKEIVARKIEHRRLLSVGAIDNQTRQFPGTPTWNHPPQLLFEYCMIDGRKVVPDIEFHEVPVAAQVALGEDHRALGTHTLAIGKYGGPKTSFKQRIDLVTQSVMDNPVAKRCRADQTALVFVDVKLAVWTRVVASICKLTAKGSKIIRHPVVKINDIVTITSPGGCGVRSCYQIFVRHECFKHLFPKRNGSRPSHRPASMMSTTGPAICIPPGFSVRTGMVSKSAWIAVRVPGSADSGHRGLRHPGDLDSRRTSHHQPKAIVVVRVVRVVPVPVGDAQVVGVVVPGTPAQDAVR
jgi:hypothetical protein